MRYLPDNNLSYPVSIKIGDSLGSGFYFRTDKELFLITAKHVIFARENILFSNLMSLTSNEENTTKNKIHIQVDMGQIELRKKEHQDIVLILLGEIISKSETKLKNGVKIITKNSGKMVVVPSNLLKKYDDVLVSNEVFILGYPTLNAGMQINPEQPLQKRNYCWKE